MKGTVSGSVQVYIPTIQICLALFFWHQSLSSVLRFSFKNSCRPRTDWWRSCEISTGVQISNLVPTRWLHMNQLRKQKYFWHFLLESCSSFFNTNCRLSWWTTRCTSGTWRCRGSTRTLCWPPTSPPWRSARARTTSFSPSCSRCLGFCQILAMLFIEQFRNILHES